MTRYGTLRTWAAVLKIAGFLMVVLTLFGQALAAIADIGDAVRPS